MPNPTPLFPGRAPASLPDTEDAESTLAEWLLASVIFLVAVGEVIFIAATV